MVICRPVTSGGEAPLDNFSLALEKCVGHNLKILDRVHNVWAPLGKLFALPGVPSWLRARLFAVRVSLFGCPGP